MIQCQVEAMASLNLIDQNVDCGCDGGEYLKSGLAILLGFLALVVGCEPPEQTVDTTLEEEQIWTTRAGDVAQWVGPGVRLSGETEPSVEMVSTSPLVEFSGDYTWTIQLGQSEGNMSDRVTARPHMPDHGHGTLPAVVESIVEEGVASLAPLNLYMGGIWEVGYPLLRRRCGVTFSVFIYVEG